MWADDLLITYRGLKEKARIFHKYFKLYYSWSGQEMNKEKSSIFFSKNTARAQKRAITDLLGIKEMGHSSIFFGKLSCHKSKSLKRILVSKGKSA